ncbi:MAG: N-acetylmuramoyl-L-alanine amidase [Myxococcales bacterium]|nr:N-acetylmuramoyl-L-alanine amidase [Myxococcales bacterium]
MGPGGVSETVPPDFEMAVGATDVPPELLFAIARAETGLQMVTGEVEFEGQDPAHGLMGLRGFDLELAADLAGLDPELVKTDRDANLAAAAALLAAIAEEMQIDTSDINAWAPVVARYSGIEGDEGMREYVHREVYAALAEGIEVEGYALPGQSNIAPDYPAPLIDTQRGRDAGSIWTPSPNKNSRGGRTPEYVIIHTCEGSYSGCWSWLSNSASGVSAHYVVNDSGSEVRALVDEDDRAWHISADYACSRNDSVDCGNNGTSMNTLSVGIEHAGYSSQSSWSSGLIQRSAELTCGITERNGIPRDAYHIIGHGQMQPWNRSDPGPNWPWSTYLSKVQEACGDGGTTPTPSGSSVVIDSNNTANATSQYYVDVSDNWWGSASTPGYWNTGYWVAPTAAVSDAAEFWFFSNAGGCYDVDAHWSSGSNRAPNATFIGWNASGTEVGRASVDQRSNGNRWNALGNWNFSSGWNQVLLSRWTASGSYVIADAVRVTPAACN